MSDDRRHAYLTRRSTLICASCHQPIRRGLDWVGPDFSVKKCERTTDGERCNQHHLVSQATGPFVAMLPIRKAEFIKIRRAAKDGQPVHIDRIYDELGVYGPPPKAVGE